MIDTQLSLVEFETVQVVNCILARFLVTVLTESHTSWSSCLAVDENSELNDGAILAEEFFEFLFVGAPWNVTDED